MGRTNFSGPVQGAYAIVHFSSETAAATREFKVPFDCRVMSVSAHAHAGTTPTYVITNDTDTTTILASRTIPTTPETLEGASLSNRDMDKGDVLKVVISGTGVVGDVWVTLKTAGHAVATAADD